MSRRYRWQAGLFDPTRRPILLGRRHILDFLETGDHVMEVGCGTGSNLGPIAVRVGRRGRVVGIECARAMARRAKKRAEMSRRKLARACPDIEVFEAVYGVERPATNPQPTIAGMAFDAVLFSYSLTMIPDFRAAIRQAGRDLRPGGRIVVLDFVDTPVGWMRTLIESCGVELGEERHAYVAQRCEVQHLSTRAAWGGLWRYRTLVGRDRG